MNKSRTSDVCYLNWDVSHRSWHEFFVLNLKATVCILTRILDHSTLETHIAHRLRNANLWLIIITCKGWMKAGTWIGRHCGLRGHLCFYRKSQKLKMASRTSVMLHSTFSPSFQNHASVKKVFHSLQKSVYNDYLRKPLNLPKSRFKKKWMELCIYILD